MELVELDDLMMESKLTNSWLFFCESGKVKGGRSGLRCIGAKGKEEEEYEREDTNALVSSILFRVVLLR